LQRAPECQQARRRGHVREKKRWEARVDARASRRVRGRRDPQREQRRCALGEAAAREGSASSGRRADAVDDDLDAEAAQAASVHYAQECQPQATPGSIPLGAQDHRAQGEPQTLEPGPRRAVAAMIRKLPDGRYRLYSRKPDAKTGRRRNLGTFRTRVAAERHERAVQFFKRH
jgi:hypothetical protein